jgi:glycosyltransferase involved in cell wall biosynthesis
LTGQLVIVRRYSKRELVNIGLKTGGPAPRQKVEGGLRTKTGHARRPDPQRVLVSVITVCRNSEEHIERTIESVINQTYPDIEYIIVDGGSTDSTLDIIRKHEDRISYWVSEPDEGIFDAMNKGISLATGDLVGIINSDDWYFEYTVQDVVNASLEDPGAQVFFGAMYYVDRDGRFQWAWESSLWEIENDFQMSHPTCFIRRSVYDDYRYQTKYRLLSDYDLMLRLHLAGMRFNRIERPLAWFTLGGASDVYYRTRAEGYKVRWEQGLLSSRRYVYKRLALVLKAPIRALMQAIGRSLFKEIDTLQATCGDLRASRIALEDTIERALANIAMLESEIERASAHIAMLEGEISDKNTYIEHLEERILAAESAGHREAGAPVPSDSGKRTYISRNEGLLHALGGAWLHLIRKAGDRKVRHETNRDQ